MSDAKERVKAAFDSVKMPPHLKADTLKKIAQATSASTDTGTFGANRQTKTKRKLFGKVAAALAACLMLGAIGFGGHNLYATETAVVSITLNPAIELGVNRFDIVVDARALNADGQQVLDNVALVGKKYQQALTILTNSEAFTSYVDDRSLVDVYISCNNTSQSESLLSSSETEIDKLPCRSNCRSGPASSKHHMGGKGMGRGGANHL